MTNIHWTPYFMILNMVNTHNFKLGLVHIYAMKNLEVFDGIEEYEI